MLEYEAGVPRAWAEAFARLYHMSAPPGLPPGRWQRLLDDAGGFLDHWLGTAIALDWTPDEVFGGDLGPFSVHGNGPALVAHLDGAIIEALDCAGCILRTSGGERLEIRQRWRRCRSCGVRPE